MYPLHVQVSPGLLHPIVGLGVRELAQVLRLMNAITVSNKVLCP